MAAAPAPPEPAPSVAGAPEAAPSVAEVYAPAAVSPPMPSAPLEPAAPPQTEMTTAPIVAPPAPAIEPPPALAANSGKGDQVASKDSNDQGPFGGLGMSSNKGPTKIASESLSFDYPKKTAIFSGHVRVSQPNGMMSSDKLRVLYNDNMKEIKTAYADGNVRISQGDRWATGDHAVLDQSAQTVTLTGSPVVHDGAQTQITGSSIIVRMKTQEFVVKDAHAVLFPKSKDTDGSASNSSR